MADLIVPKLNNNDATYTIVEWLRHDGQRVRRGEPVLVLETSKATMELECERDGVLQSVVSARVECRHGDVVGHIFSTEEERREFLASREEPPSGAAPPVEVVITNSARALAEELGVSTERLRSLGKRVIRSEDVELLVNSVPQAMVQPLSRTQQAVASVVAESHRTIPSAFMAVKVQVDEALAAAQRLSRETRSLVGLPELLIKAVAGLQPSFPLFFGSLAGDGTVRLARTANVGVTVDVGNGLFVPVVRDAQRLTCKEIADVLLDFRAQAMEGRFRQEDVADANIMVSLHNDPGVVLGGPIIHPGQVCVVCLAGTQHELVLDDVGEVATRRTANVSMVYDHRVVNGRDAVLLLQGVKAALEAPVQLTVEPA